MGNCCTTPSSQKNKEKATQNIALINAADDSPKEELQSPDILPLLDSTAIMTFNSKFGEEEDLSPLSDGDLDKISQLIQSDDSNEEENSNEDIQDTDQIVKNTNEKFAPIKE